MFWLHADRERIGMLEFSEYDLEPGVYWDEFWRWADGLGQHGIEPLTRNATRLTRHFMRAEIPMARVDL